MIWTWILSGARAAGRALRPAVRGGAALMASAALALLPVAAFAQDHDENTPMDPQAKQFQLWSYTVIGVLVVLFVIWYLVRRYQTLHSGHTVEGSYRDDE